MIGNAEWWSRLKINRDRTEIFLDTWCSSRFKRSIRTYSRLLNNLNEDEKRFEKTTSEIINSLDHSVGFSIPILEILDLKNGWLDNGTLFFEYGIQVDAVMRFNFWEFNFYDKLFNAGAEMIQFSRKYSGCLYAHCQLLKHQSPTLENTVTVRGGHDELCFFPLVLQIAHGVQFKLELIDLYSVISMASKQGMSNVIHYCDVLLTQTQEHSSYKAVDRYWIHFAIEYNLKRWMVQLLKTMKSVKDCIDKEDIEMMSNESMKMFIAKFLYQKF
ncbi:unnamed protein product [Caenorhabditis brenneri]